MRRTGDELAAGYDLLLTSLNLCRDPAALYGRAPDDVRRTINETFAKRFFIDEHEEVAASMRKPTFHELPDAAQAYSARQLAKTRGAPENEKTPGIAGGPDPQTEEHLPLGLPRVFWPVVRIRPNWSG